MAHPLVEKHFPMVAELERSLERLTASAHVVGSGAAGAGGPMPSVSSPARAYTRSEIDAIHEGLLRKNRQSGSLRLT